MHVSFRASLSSVDLTATIQKKKSFTLEPTVAGQTVTICITHLVVFTMCKLEMGLSSKTHQHDRAALEENGPKWEKDFHCLRRLRINKYQQSIQIKAVQYFKWNLRLQIVMVKELINNYIVSDMVGFPRKDKLSL